MAIPSWSVKFIDSPPPANGCSPCSASHIASPAGIHCRSNVSNIPAMYKTCCASSQASEYTAATHQMQSSSPPSGSHLCVDAWYRPTFKIPTNFFPSQTRSEEHTSEHQSLMRQSYYRFCVTISTI